MTPAEIAEIISASAVVVGLIFAIIQVRHMRAARRREAALELLHSCQTLEFAEALHLISRIPANLPKAELEKQVGDRMGLVYSMMGTWESLGILVHRREVELELVADLLSGPIVMSWRTLERFVREERQDLRRDTPSEWFQWLAERIMEREVGKPSTPAYIAYKDWQPKR